MSHLLQSREPHALTDCVVKSEHEPAQTDTPPVKIEEVLTNPLSQLPLSLLFGSPLQSNFLLSSLQALAESNPFSSSALRAPFGNSFLPFGEKGLGDTERPAIDKCIICYFWVYASILINF